MRPVLTRAALGIMVLTAGCDRWTRQDNRHVENRVWTGAPRAEELVRTLNDNARRITSLECLDMEIDAKQDGQPVGLSGSLACQKPPAPGTPPNFRMEARMVGKREVDIGSNAQEFWFWVARAPEPNVYFCSYEDYRAGRARLPFPFQPEWIVEALGVGEYDPNVKYEVKDHERVVDLKERAVSPQGQAVWKITRFNKSPKRGEPRVQARYLVDEKGKTICEARTAQVQVDGTTGAEVPRVVTLSWPQDKMELKLTMSRVRVNTLVDSARSAALFSRRDLGNMRNVDLARGPDTPTSNIRPAGAVLR